MIEQSRGRSASRAPSPAVPWRASWVAYATCLCALVYAAMKLYLAAEGRLGLPGGPPVAEEKYEQYDHVVLRQLGLVAVDLLAAGIALATVQSWGRIVPRRLLVVGLGVGLLALVAGAAAVLQHTFFGEGPARWSNLVLAAFVVAWVILWGVTAWSYACRLRDGG